jgi:hypothetical protein
MELLMLPLMVLNTVGAVVSGIWLLILREWLLVGLGLAIGLLGNWLIGLAIMLGMLLFGTPGMALAQKNKKTVAMFFALLNALYVSALITTWCLGTLYLFVTVSKSSSIIPITLWAYGASTAPWAYLAYKDQQSGGNEFSSMSIFFAQIAFVIVGLIKIIGNAPFKTLIIIFGAVMAVDVILEMIMAITGQSRESIGQQ